MISELENRLLMINRPRSNQFDVAKDCDVTADSHAAICGVCGQSAAAPTTASRSDLGLAAPTGDHLRVYATSVPGCVRGPGGRARAAQPERLRLHLRGAAGG
jgi:hypothetical protein